MAEEKDTTVAAPAPASAPTAMVPGTAPTAHVAVKRVDGRVKLNPRYVVAGMAITLGGKPCVVADDLTIPAPAEVTDEMLRPLGAALA